MVRVDGIARYIQFAFPPPYAPDLNLVEYLWAWLKRHAPANYCPDNLSELQIKTRKKLKLAQTINHRRLLDAGYFVVMS